jgi:outer membrane protein assembly factor BamD (BamD/ComL family)
MMNMKRLFFAPLFLFLFFSCVTSANLTDDLSPAELIQRGQEAMDRNRYSVAAQYYQALHERNRNSIDLIITAEYHIAFIYYKQGRFDQARQGFNALLEYYNSPDQELLPQHFRRLSQIVLERMDKAEKSRRSLFSRR